MEWWTSCDSAAQVTQWRLRHWSESRAELSNPHPNPHTDGAPKTQKTSSAPISVKQATNSNTTILHSWFSTHRPTSYCYLPTSTCNTRRESSPTVWKYTSRYWSPGSLSVHVPWDKIIWSCSTVNKWVALATCSHPKLKLYNGHSFLSYLTHKVSSKISGDCSVYSV